MRRIGSGRLGRMTDEGTAAPSPDPALVAVIGAGTMGAGIAQVALEGGWRVALHDPFPGATDRALDRIRQGLQRRAEKAGERDPARFAAARLLSLEVKRGQSPPPPPTRISPIEAVVEDLEVKRALFRDLDEAAPPDAVLATNTSALSVTKIAEAAPGRSGSSGSTSSTRRPCFRWSRSLPVAPARRGPSSAPRGSWRAGARRRFESPTPRGSSSIA
jgi:hypothetical protein